MVTLYAPRPEFSPEEQQKFRIALAQVPTGPMDSSARAAGEIVRPLEEFPLGENRMLFVVASQTKLGGREYSLIQYFLLGQRTGLLITMEGFGSPSDVSADYELRLRQATWVE
jgi:hypothetical protein